MVFFAANSELRNSANCKLENVNCGLFLVKCHIFRFLSLSFHLFLFYQLFVATSQSKIAILRTFRTLNKDIRNLWDFIYPCDIRFRGGNKLAIQVSRTAIFFLSYTAVKSHVRVPIFVTVRTN